VLCLVVEGRSSSPAEGAALERVRCQPGNPQADLAFELPWFEPSAATRQTFENLSDEQLVEYRGALRQRLDRCVMQFDPQVIHCQHAWLFAHLALESGVPYVITAHGPELELARRQPRYGRFVEQAIENASRLLVHNRPAYDQLAALFPESSTRIEQLPPVSEADPAAWIAQHVACYEAALTQRFGH
jgi:hypothetical protein